MQQLLRPDAEDAEALRREAAFVLHPRERKTPVLDAQLLGEGRDRRGRGVVLLEEDEAQVLRFVFVCLYLCMIEYRKEGGGRIPRADQACTVAGTHVPSFCH